ncbi:Transposable element Tcb2 transposase [Vespula maculifrons]|uniref:Transposable element Tcb2 transposase n=1 Tax=Vespula maculifrons TaxID=7453 RepID=A0ABD2CUJ8_VESMC
MNKWEKIGQIIGIIWDKIDCIWRSIKKRNRSELFMKVVIHFKKSAINLSVDSDMNNNVSIISKNLNKTKEVKNMLKYRFKISVQMNIRTNLKFYQNNDPKDKSSIVQECLLYNCPKVLDIPSLSHCQNKN